MEPYKINEQIFIIWGGNLPLAKKVGNRIESKGLAAIVGGSSTSDTDTSFLGPNILKQMDASSRVIILAHPEFDEKRKKHLFRNNLMFEWGYMLGRTPPTHIHVYLIECKRSDLPSDLHGVYCEEVPSQPGNGKTLSESQKETFQAKFICNDFMKKLDTPDTPTVFDVFANWTYWKNFISGQLKGETAPQPHKLRRALRYSFIPIAYYGEDPGELRRLLSQIDVRANSDLHDLAALRGITDYLSRSRAEGEISKGAFDAIKRSFSSYANPTDSETAILVRYAMGLCLSSEGFHKDHSTERRNQLWGYANENLLEAYSILSGTFDFRRSGIKKIEIDSASATLWKAYICRHIGRLKFEIGENDAAIKYYEECIECRSIINQRLDLKGESYYSNLYMIETLIFRLQLLRLSEKLTTSELEEIKHEYEALRIPSTQQSKIIEREIADADEFINRSPRLI